MTAAPRRPLPILSRPWFWVLLIGALFSVPLIKGLGAERPEPLPGWDAEPLTLRLPDETGRETTLTDLSQHLVLVTDLPLANAVASDEAFARLRTVRKRLRGLGDAVVYLVLAHGGDVPALLRLLDRMTAHKPSNVFLLDEDRTTLDRLREQAGSPAADWILLDRHGRARGVYGPGEAEVDRLAADAGALANWIGEDPEPGQPVHD